MTQNSENAAKKSAAVGNLLQAMAWRCIGPPRGGRVVTVAGDPINPAVFYFGACAGGVWKTTDAGITWHNVSDGYFKTASVGAIAVAPSDPNVIYAGMGEATIRIDVSHGDGVYKSTDAGETWTHIGLSDTRHIGKIRVHPQNPDIVRHRQYRDFPDVPGYGKYAPCPSSRYDSRYAPHQCFSTCPNHWKHHPLGSVLPLRHISH